MLSYKLSKFRRAVLVLAAVGCLGTIGQAQTPVLELRVSTESVPLPAGGGTIKIYITNHVDTIAGFQVWLMLDRPDVIKFVETTNPHLQFDISGTVMGDWQIVDVRTLSGYGYDAYTIGLADDITVPPLVHGFGPSDTERELIKIPFVFLPGVDTMTDRIVNIFVNSDFKDHFAFSRPNGTLIDGIDVINGVIDTTKIKVRPGMVTPACSADGDVNVDGIPLTVADWVELIRIYNGMIPLDSQIWRADLNGDCIIDSVDVNLYECLFQHGMSCLPGWPRVTCCNPQIKLCCAGLVGNVDCDPGNSVDISDLTALIDHLYVTLTPLCCWGEANIDGAASIDISDLTALIDNLYVTFTPLSVPACAQ
jgi:hypothetical protein